MASPPEPRFRITRFRKPFWAQGGLRSRCRCSRPPSPGQATVCGGFPPAAAALVCAVLGPCWCAWAAPRGWGCAPALPRFCGSGLLVSAARGRSVRAGLCSLAAFSGRYLCRPRQKRMRAARTSVVLDSYVPYWFGRVGRAPRGPCRVGTCVWAGQGPSCAWVGGRLLGGCSRSAWRGARLLVSVFWRLCLGLLPPGRDGSAD